MSYLLLDVYDNARVRQTAKTITSGSGNFENDSYGRAILDASTATWVTAGTRIGDYVMVGGTREIHRVTTGAATTVTGGESFKFFNGDNSRAYVLWLTKNGSGSAPTVTTETLLGPVNITTGQTAAQVATAIRAGLNATGAASLTTAFKDIIMPVGGTGSNVDITNIRPGNCTNVALFSGTLTGWTFTATTAGTAASANDGVYRVREIISETRLVLEQGWPSAGIAVAGSATTFCERNRLVITDEATITTANIHSNVNNPRISEQLPIGPTSSWDYTCYIFRIREITIVQTGATTTDLNMTKSVIMSAGGSTNNAEATHINVLPTNPGTTNINSGVMGSDTKSVKEGCFLVGLTFNAGANTTLNFAASAFMARSGQSLWGGAGCKLSGILYLGTPPLMGNLNGYDTLNNFILSTQSVAAGFTIITTIDSSDNILVADVLVPGFLFQTDDFTISGLDLGDDFTPPLFNLFGTTTPTVLDPFQDFTIPQLFFNTGGLGTKAYTFNPTFVFRDEGTRSPLPIEDLQIDITRISITQIATVTTFSGSSTYRTNIDGTNVDVVGVTSDSATATAIAAAINANGTLNTYVYAESSGADVYIRPTDLYSDLAITLSVIGGSGVYDLTPQTETGPDVYTTNVNGKINAGAGITLARGVLDFGFEDYYKYNILVQGGSIKTRRYYFVPRSKFDDDIVFDVQQFDLEGELTA